MLARFCSHYLWHSGMENGETPTGKRNMARPRSDWKARGGLAFPRGKRVVFHPTVFLYHLTEPFYRLLQQPKKPPLSYSGGFCIYSTFHVWERSLFVNTFISSQVCSYHYLFLYVISQFLQCLFFIRSVCNQFDIFSCTNRQTH